MQLLPGLPSGINGRDRLHRLRHDNIDNPRGTAERIDSIRGVFVWRARALCARAGLSNTSRQCAHRTGVDEPAPREARVRVSDTRRLGGRSSRQLSMSAAASVCPFGSTSLRSSRTHPAAINMRRRVAHLLGLPCSGGFASVSAARGLGVAQRPQRGAVASPGGCWCFVGAAHALECDENKERRRSCQTRTRRVPAIASPRERCLRSRALRPTVERSTKQLITDIKSAR